MHGQTVADAMHAHRIALMFYLNSKELFKKKLMPVVIERLAKAFNAVGLHAKAEIATRVQNAVESGVAIDAAIWDVLLSEALAASPPDQQAAPALQEALERLRGAEENQH